MNPAELSVAMFLADQNPHRDRSLGISGMTLSLIDQLRSTAGISVRPVVSRSSLLNDQTGRDGSGAYRLPWRTDHTVGRLAGDWLHPWLVRHRVDVWYYPKGYLSPIARPPAPTVGTMHDAIIQHYVDHYPGSRSGLKYWTTITRRSLQRFETVLTVSQHAKRQLLAFCERHRLTPPNIRVTYESSDWEQYRDREFVKRDQVLHLASDAPHKQTSRFLNIWETLQRRRDDLPQLILVGKLDAAGRQALTRIKGVALRDHLAREELVELVGQSRVIILPSEIEGFGLPALEAHYVNTPVCFVRGTAIAEILGRDADVGGFELDDVDSFETALDAKLNLPRGVLDQIKQRLFETYSRSACLQRVVGELYAAAGKRSPLASEPMRAESVASLA